VSSLRQIRNSRHLLMTGLQLRDQKPRMQGQRQRWRVKGKSE
jgi:hypothetical protein